MNHPVAVISLIHEPADLNSAARLFRGEPVLAWTLRRLERVSRIHEMIVLCWEDQLTEVEPIAGGHGANVLVKSPRTALPTVQAVTSARKWANGSGGELLGAKDFDLGLYAPWTLEAMHMLEADAALLVDPAAALVDPAILDELIARARDRDAVQLAYSPAPAGLGGAVVRPALLERVSEAPSVLLDAARPGEIDDQIPLADSLAQSQRSFKLDSFRQISRITHAMLPLNGQLMQSDAEAIAAQVATGEVPEMFPREVVLELTTQRLSRPTFASPATEIRHVSPESVASLLAECVSYDDVRLTLGGLGDPLLDDRAFEIIRTARAAGIAAIRLETDLLDCDSDRISWLAAAALDVVLVHIPAATRESYRTVMGIDAFDRVIQNLSLLESEQAQRRQGVPLVIPVFVETGANHDEIAAWKRRWPDGMLASQVRPVPASVTVLADGRVVSCAANSAAPLGDLAQDPLSKIWTHRTPASIPASHATHCPPCVRCGQRHAA